MNPSRDFFQRLFNKSDESETEKEPEPLAKEAQTAPAPEEQATATATLNGQSFRLCSSVDELCAAIEADGRGILKLRSIKYGGLLGELMRRLNERYGSGSQYTRDLFSSPLVCAGCRWDFPGSYLLSLQSPDMFGGRMWGATGGFDAFGKTGVCPQCGSDQSLLVYEHFKPESIGAADVEAIRRYWQALAQKWWQQNGHRAQAICDQCNSDIAGGKGYLSGSRLICEECIHGGLMTEGLERLRSDPNYYGAGLLRKARGFRG